MRGERELRRQAGSVASSLVSPEPRLDLPSIRHLTIHPPPIRTVLDSAVFFGANDNAATTQSRRRP